MVEFFYILLRDHMLGGEVEAILLKMSSPIECQYSNGFTAQYAENIVSRLNKLNP